MSHKRIFPTDIFELGETNLSNDRTKLATRGRDPVRRRTITSGEDFTRNDECSGIGSEVLEEIGEAVKEDESLVRGIRRRECTIRETENTEEDGENDETHQLNRFTTPTIDEEESDPIAWDEASDDENEVADCNVLEVLVDADGFLCDRRIW